MNFDVKLQVGQGRKNVQKPVPSPDNVDTTIPKQKEHKKGSVTTSTPQSLDYITVKGIESATSKYRLEWPEWSLGCTTKFREHELIRNLAERYDLDTINARAKVLTSVYRDNE